MSPKLVKKDPYEDSSLPTLSIGVAIIAVSFAAILIRWSDAHPLVLAFYRLLFTLAMLTPFAFIDMRKELKAGLFPDRNDTLKLLAVGFVLACHFALWVTSLRLTTVASSVLLVTFHPIFVGIVGFYFLKERLSKINIFGMLVALIGTFVLLYGDFEKGGGGSLTGGAVLGDILAFLGGMAAGVYILSGRYFRRTIGAMTYVFFVYLSATISLLIMCLAVNMVSFFSDSIETVVFTYPPKEFLLFFLMALGPGLFGHTVYNWALKYVRATVVSVSLLGEPIGSSIMAFFLLSESPPATTLVGGMGILLGIYLTAMSSDKPKSCPGTTRASKKRDGKL